MAKKQKPEWVAFNERVVGAAEGTGRKVCVRIREVSYVSGDGRGSVLFLRCDSEPIAVTEDIQTVMMRLEP